MACLSLSLSLCLSLYLSLSVLLSVSLCLSLSFSLSLSVCLSLSLCLCLSVCLSLSLSLSVCRSVSLSTLAVGWHQLRPCPASCLPAVLRQQQGRDSPQAQLFGSLESGLGTCRQLGPGADGALSSLSSVWPPHSRAASASADFSRRDQGHRDTCPKRGGASRATPPRQASAEPRHSFRHVLFMGPAQRSF